LSEKQDFRSPTHFVALFYRPLQMLLDEITFVGFRTLDTAELENINVTETEEDKKCKKQHTENQKNSKIEI